MIFYHIKSLDLKYNELRDTERDWTIVKITIIIFNW
jgi:hypothetical protein